MNSFFNTIDFYISKISTKIIKIVAGVLFFAVAFCNLIDIISILRNLFEQFYYVYDKSITTSLIVNSIFGIISIIVNICTIVLFIIIGFFVIKNKQIKSFFVPVLVFTILQFFVLIYNFIDHVLILINSGGYLNIIRFKYLEEVTNLIFYILGDINNIILIIALVFLLVYIIRSKKNNKRNSFVLPLICMVIYGILNVLFVFINQVILRVSNSGSFTFINGYYLFNLITSITSAVLFSACVICFVVYLEKLFIDKNSYNNDNGELKEVNTSE